MQVCSTGAEGSNLGHELPPLEGLEHKLLQRTESSRHCQGWGTAYGEDASRADGGPSGSPLGLAQTAAGKVEPGPEVESAGFRVENQRWKNVGFRVGSGVKIPHILISTPC